MTDFHHMYSSILANDEHAPTEVNFQAIRDREKPENWDKHFLPDVDPEEVWQWNITSELQRAAFAVWCFYSFIQDLGWVDHTNDWDWWIRITKTDGSTLECDCGSEIQGMVDDDGVFWNDPHYAAHNANWHDREGNRMKSYRIFRMWFNEDTDTTEEETIDISLDDIHTIIISYDT